MKVVILPGYKSVFHLIVLKYFYIGLLNIAHKCLERGSLMGLCIIVNRMFVRLHLSSQSFRICVSLLSAHDGKCVLHFFV